MPRCKLTCWLGSTTMAVTKGSYTKEQWADPAFRERMKERDANLKRLRAEADPWRIKPWGIPCNIKGKKTQAERKAARADAMDKWRAAHKLADKYLDYMKKT